GHRGGAETPPGERGAARPAGLDGAFAVPFPRGQGGTRPPPQSRSEVAEQGRAPEEAHRASERDSQKREGAAEGGAEGGAGGTAGERGTSERGRVCAGNGWSVGAPSGV